MNAGRVEKMKGKVRSRKEERQHRWVAHVRKGALARLRSVTIREVTKPLAPLLG